MVVEQRFFSKKMQLRTLGLDDPIEQKCICSKWIYIYIFFLAARKNNKQKKNTRSTRPAKCAGNLVSFLALVRLRPIVQTCQDVAILMTNRNLVRFWGIQSRMLNLVTIRIYCNFGFGDPELKSSLGGGFKYFLFSSLLGEDSHFD